MFVVIRRETFLLLLLVASSGLGGPGAEAQGRGAVQISKANPMVDNLRWVGDTSTLPIQFPELFGYDLPRLRDACGSGGWEDLPAGVACDRLESAGGLGHAAAGVGLRNLGQGTISLRGVPAGANLVAAWLYVGLIDRDTAFPPMLRFEGAGFAAEPVGSSDEPCWDLGGAFQLYRAAVTEWIEPGINGEYVLSSVPSFKRDASDPFREEAPGLPLAEGASLVVVYQHWSLPRAAQVFVHEGPARLRVQRRIEHSLSVPLAIGAHLRHTRLGGDGQVWGPEGRTGQIGTFFGDGLGNWIQLRGPGSPYDPVGDWRGLDGGPVTRLWDTQTSEIPTAGGPLQEGATRYRVMYSVLEGLEPPPGEGGTCSEAEEIDPATFEPEFMDDMLVDCVVIGAHVMSVTPFED